ncbi:MAG: DNA polymerase III subunit alpha [Mycobacteriales bacterium]
MSDPFVHLHVASGYSMRYGAASPEQLVARAVDHGMTALALTDRDGLYGAVRFVAACAAAGIRPVLGVDLAVRTEAHTVAHTETHAEAHTEAHTEAAVAGRSRRPTPARGGAYLDERLPRVTLLAGERGGWAALCRLVSRVHLDGVRGKPVATLTQIAEHADKLFVLLGADSDVGRAVHDRRLEQAQRRLSAWLVALGGPQRLRLEVVHRGGRGDAVRAARLTSFAADVGLGAVLTNAVRYADPCDAPVADLLDAARRLVVLHPRHLDRWLPESGLQPGEAYLKSGKEMAQVAEEVTDSPTRLLAETRRLAEQCVLDPRRDLGIGDIHFPELELAAGMSPGAALRARCEAGLIRRGGGGEPARRDRLAAELELIEALGYPGYFLTVAEVTDLIRSRGIRVAARGSAAGSLVTYLCGISDVDPMAHGLVMERFLSPLRRALPDIDIDVESARREEVYRAILDRFGAARVSCVAMFDTYRARHAIRDVGAALGLPPGEVDVAAKAFPHIRAGQIRAALRDLPELRNAGLDADPRFESLFRLAERLDGLPRHIALHPSGVLLADRSLLDRTPVENSAAGFPMSQFDKDDVEQLGLLKLDVLGVRMQSAMAHTLAEITRVDGVAVCIDELPRDDPATFRLIRSTRTLGCFQIESPGQRELIGKFAPETFADLIIDISLFRPGPVKTDMVTPFLQVRHGWRAAVYPHPDLRPVLEETNGVVVFHEQVIRMISVLTGCDLAQADEARRGLGDPDGLPEVRAWFRAAARTHGYPVEVVTAAWEVLAGFASFGFCKAHAAAFALPTYQSAWLKAHHPAAFLAGVLTHDPGMYPKRLILDDARQFGIAVLPLDVNASAPDYRIEKISSEDEPPPAILGGTSRPPPEPGLPDGRCYGIRIALSDVRGLSEVEIARMVAGRPYGSLSDFWARAAISRPVVERLILAGGFDSIYGLGSSLPVRRRGQLTRRDLLLQLAELETGPRAVRRVGRSAGPTPVQLPLFTADPIPKPSGLPEMTGAEQVRAELEVLGLDASRHVLTGYQRFLNELGVTRSRQLLGCRSGAPLLVAGVKVATQTPPVRSGRRVVFLTLDDATGPVDITFFEDAQAVAAATLFHGWLLVVSGLLRRTGERGVSLRATGCWDLPELCRSWRSGGMAVVRSIVTEPAPVGSVGGRAQVYANGFELSPYADVRSAGTTGAPRRLWHASTGSAGG